MYAQALFYLTLGSTLGAGVIGGTFFAFSSFVLPALAKLPAAQGVAAMQSINVTVLNRSFLGVFVGTTVLCSIVALLSTLAWSTAGSKLRIAGSALYVVGTFVVTMARNVPLNDALMNVSPVVAEAAQMWSRYVPEWTMWNTVRALGAAVAAMLLTLSLVQSVPGG